MKRSNQEGKKKRKDMSASERLSQLQGKLYQKAKQEADYRFYILYDKLQLDYVLEISWKQVKRNGGAAGVDGVSIASLVKGQKYKEVLEEVKEALRTESYKPQPVKRVYIPKANGKQRPLGIPTVRDRIVQTACKLILEPIFEADFEESSYGFRPKRSSKDAMKQIKTELQNGRTQVLDADLSSYFDTIPHTKLLKTVAQKLRDNIKDYLSKRGHYGVHLLVPELNRKLVGWINYFTIDKVSYPAVAKGKLRYYLMHKLNRYYKRKSQRASHLYRRGAFDELVKWGLVDPTKYKPKTPAKA